MSREALKGFEHIESETILVQSTTAKIDQEAAEYRTFEAYGGLLIRTETQWCAVFGDPPNQISIFRKIPLTAVIDLNYYMRSGDEKVLK